MEPSLVFQAASQIRCRSHLSEGECVDSPVTAPAKMESNTLNVTMKYAVDLQRHELQFREYASRYANSFRSAIDYQFKEEPRQVLCGFLLFCTLSFLAYQDSIFGEGVKTDHSLTAQEWCSPMCSMLIGTYGETLSIYIRRVLLGCLCALCVYSFLQSRDGLHVRPHPGVWRIIHAIGIFYFLVLVVLSILPPSTGRGIIGIIFPEIASFRDSTRDNVFQGTIELDCRINPSTLWRQVRGPWFISHVIGWIVKMCVFRDWAYCLIYSASFELFELSLQWIIPEFAECWWDSIILDFFGANMIGMLIGVLCLRLLNSPCYDWIGHRRICQKTVFKCLPFTWSKYKWGFFQKPWRLLQALLMLLISNILELNVFFLMYALNIPATHYINPVRCIVIVALGSAAVAEHYQYMNLVGNRLGHNEWLLVIICSFECLLCAKYGAAKIADAVPPYQVVVPWVLTSIWFTLWCLIRFTNCFRQNLKIMKPGFEQHGSDSTLKNIATQRIVTKDSVSTTDSAEEAKGSSGTTASIWQNLDKIPLVLTVLPLLYLGRMYHF